MVVLRPKARLPIFGATPCGLVTYLPSRCVQHMTQYTHTHTHTRLGTVGFSFRTGARLPDNTRVRKWC